MTTEPSTLVPYVEHIGMTRQYWRDIILGINDGLVSMLLLVAGVVGGGLDADQVLLTGVAGAIAGAVSMAAGEYLATKSQDEVLTAELDLERTHIAHYRDVEVAQIREMLTDMGVHADDLEVVANALTREDETLLNAMKALEFGVVDSERRSPYRAMVMSGLLFLGGSLSSVLPFIFVEDPTIGLLFAGAITAVGLFGVGVVKAIVTRSNHLVSGAENLLIAGLGGIVAWWVGKLIGVGLT
ncbi:MAG: VIT1/CCC1 transporter family protein [Acidimicrobiia bacterium]|nr:VIT1/CCC1 transporter family protein [Acidimicrobiia bacterium]